MDVIINW